MSRLLDYTGEAIRVTILLDICISGDVKMVDIGEFEVETDKVAPCGRICVIFLYEVCK